MDGRAIWTLLAVLFGSLSASAGPILDRLRLPRQLAEVNATLAGHLDDYTDNHRVDRRVWSAALGEKRDLYVYTPPGYQPELAYPVLIWLHGFRQDESSFLDIVRLFDDAMRSGKLPKFIVVAPDGSLQGRPTQFRAGSFYLNSRAGRFEDYIQCDVWNFVTAHYRIRPERAAHVLAGGSMGGFGAFNHGFKHKQRYGIIVGLLPPVNLRYVDCHGRYFTDFDPECWGFRERLSPLAPVARFCSPLGITVIRQGILTGPLFGIHHEALQALAAENPLEMLATYDIQPGELALFIGYGLRDEFNIDAQVESFLYVAAQRGLTIATNVNPHGRHSMEDGKWHFDAVAAWLRPQLAPLCPP
jgi:pimeloyl-ACP methyl ester carboxylesterase